MLRIFSATALVLGLLGCDPTNKPTMNPGQDCMQCHCTTDDTCTARALPWTAAGTIYPAYDSPAGAGVSGVHVMIVDALDAGITLVTNEAGNFYTAEPLTPPLTVSIEYQGADAGMLTQPTPAMIYGSGVPGKGVGCNGCHQPPDPTTCVPPAPIGGGLTPSGRVALPGAPFPTCGS
ncbi:MAG: hypothetical protein JST54_21220 [Deltaproteobacteria bacterium]|nr:hypothetical protein [Deltaproteobacteria bacterium]